MNYKKDTSLIQVTDYASLIWHTNMAIMECNAHEVYGPIPSLIDFLETLLHPYIDEKYTKEITAINEEEPEEGMTPNEIKRNESLLQAKQVLATHRSLMDLAYRKRFLPATSGSNSIDYVIPKGE